MKTNIQCSNCLDDENHPLGQIIDSSGICTGCRTHKEKDLIDWDEKWSVLKNKCANILKKRSEGDYDCIIPLNADAEDYYVVELALSLNLKPLLLYVNNYFGTDLSWKNLHNLETVFDLDLVTFNPNFHSYKEAVRTSLRKFSSIYWPYQALKTAYPVSLAIDMKIPIILWGGFQATEQVGKFSHYDQVEMSNWSRNQHDLFAVDEEEFFGTGAQISSVEQFQYLYPNLKQAKKVTGIYLSNHLRWDPWKQNHSMQRYGFTPENTIFTFDQYERSGSSVFYIIHDLLRFEKYGYFKIRDQLSREIRHGRISKKNANYVYTQFMKQTYDIEPFFDWIGSTKSGFKLFVKERMKHSHHKVSNTKKDIVNIKKYFDVEYFSKKGISVKNTFVIYHKGI